MDLTPELILAMWVGGIAAGAAVIAAWRVVGPGYLWLAGSIVAGFGIVTAVAGGGAPAYLGAAVAAAAVAAARAARLAAAALAASGLCFLAVALFDSPLFPALSGLGFLGAVTSVMMLGHWFLTDPRLPRRPLFILTAMAAVSFALDAAYVLAGGGLDFSGSDGVFAMAYSALAALTGLLLAGVWFSLREPRYSGVMAATGLSYLAVLTAFGLVTLGRSLVAGGLS